MARKSTKAGSKPTVSKVAKKVLSTLQSLAGQARALRKGGKESNATPSPTPVGVAPVAETPKPQPTAARPADTPEKPAAKKDKKAASKARSTAGKAKAAGAKAAEKTRAAARKATTKVKATATKKAASAKSKPASGTAGTKPKGKTAAAAEPAKKPAAKASPKATPQAKAKTPARKSVAKAAPTAKASKKAASEKASPGKAAAAKPAAKRASAGKGEPTAKAKSSKGDASKPSAKAPAKPAKAAKAVSAKKGSPKAAAKADSQHIDSILEEKRLFNPPATFSKQARIGSMKEYEKLVAKARKHPDAFWGELAENIDWFSKWDTVLEWKAPHAKWFVGGKLNVSFNCIDRHLPNKADKPAIIWEGEPGEKRTITYRELHDEVARLANGLKKLGVRKGDRVAIYMPMIPEAAFAMLACARLGAIHSVVFGGFSADSLADRINDAQAKVVITADGGYRGGKIVHLKDAVDEASKECDSLEAVVVFKRTGHDIRWHEHDVWAGDLLADCDTSCPPEEVDSEDPLFILYTSGTTGKPKGVVHTTGGYTLWAYQTCQWVFDLKDEDVYWCTADIGWVTGHSYVVYGPLANGATTLMYEGAPTIPKPDRFWDIVERYKVSIFYTAPTAIRAFIKAGDEWPEGRDLSSLRLLGTVGEPINPEAWMWYHRTIGKENCPIVDTWWQTETGGIMISPLPGATPTQPGTATLPLPGIEAEVVDHKGRPVKEPNKGGLLVVRRPWPSMMRTIWGDDERYQKTYWSHIEGVYFAGDGARRDENGYFWVLGRVDDVINVAGHRLGTAEIESALVSHQSVAEAAVVGRPDDLKGNAISAFVIPRGRTAAEANADKELVAALREHVGKEIGAIAKPDDIRFTDALPKTRSGKIMRRLLRDLAAGKKIGDTTTLEDSRVLELLREQEEAEASS